MTFLQPQLLWALPLCGVPVLIHLLNRLRFRSVRWAAMMFLVRASRRGTKMARLRQFLILFLRTLAVLALILAFSRPMVGGWLGWALGGAPDTVLLLVDRSASMNAPSAGSETSKIAKGAALLADAVSDLPTSTRVVLIESAGRQPREVKAVSGLSELLAGTDTSADIPAMFEAALAYLVRERVGSAELWVVSDLQQSNWRPDDERWAGLTGGLKGRGVPVTVRLLALRTEAGDEHTVSVRAVRRHRTAGPARLDVSFAIGAPGSGGPSRWPVTVLAENTPRQFDVSLEGRADPVFRRTIVLERDEPGWGYVEIAGDRTPYDNRSYFTYGRAQHLRSLVVSREPVLGRVLQLAVAPAPEALNHSARIVSPGAVNQGVLGETSLVVWQAPFPGGLQQKRLIEFAEAGGAVLFFPPDGDGTNSLDGLVWGPVETAPVDAPFSVSQWEEGDTLLARSAAGESLPLSEVQIRRRRCVAGSQSVLARFGDGSPFLGRRVLGAGQFVFCASLPDPAWSMLRDGTVLVPLVQRLAEAGGRRLSGALLVECGAWTQPPDDPYAEALDGEPGKDPRTRAGAYKTGDIMIAVNRPPEEDEAEPLNDTRLETLLADIPLMRFEAGPQTARLQSEAWQFLLGSMAVSLLCAGFLAQGRG